MDTGLPPKEGQFFGQLLRIPAGWFFFGVVMVCLEILLKLSAAKKNLKVAGSHIFHNEQIASKMSIFFPHKKEENVKKKIENIQRSKMNHFWYNLCFGFSEEEACSLITSENWMFHTNAYFYSCPKPP